MTSHPEHDLLSAYADGETDAHERATIESHLATCAEARELLAAIRSTLRDLDAAGEPEMDPQVSFAIRAALARERKLAGRGRRYAWAAGAAAAALIGVVGFVTLRPDGAALDRTSGAGGAALEAFSDQNYTKDSAGSLLQSEASKHAGGRSAATTTEMTAGEAGPAEDSAAAAGQFSAKQADDVGFRECLLTIEREPKDANLVRSIAARFEGEPVYLLLFEVPAGKPTRLELWVVARSGCDVRYFVQRSI